MPATDVPLPSGRRIRKLGRARAWLRVALAASAAAGVACGESDSADRAPPPSPAKVNGRLSLGEAVTLSGSGRTPAIEVRALDVDPIRGTRFDVPSSGRRFVGVELELTNVGRVRYRDAPSTGARLVTADGQRHSRTTLVKQGSCVDPGSVVMSPGASRRICIPFALAKGADPRFFRLTLDAGYGPETARWRLDRRLAASGR